MYNQEFIDIHCNVRFFSVNIHTVRLSKRTYIWTTRSYPTLLILHLVAIHNVSSSYAVAICWTVLLWIYGVQFLRGILGLVVFLLFCFFFAAHSFIFRNQLIYVFCIKSTFRASEPKNVLYKIHTNIYCEHYI